jgi:hypothetical protein
LSDSSIAHDGAHRIKQASGYQSGAVASAIEENFAAAIDAGLSCIHRCFGARIVGEAQFARFERLVASPLSSALGQTDSDQSTAILVVPSH